MLLLTIFIDVKYFNGKGWKKKKWKSLFSLFALDANQYLGRNNF